MSNTHNFNDPGVPVRDQHDEGDSDHPRSEYDPGSSVSGETWAKHGSIEDVNSRAFEQSFGKGGSPGAGQ